METFKIHFECKDQLRVTTHASVLLKLMRIIKDIYIKIEKTIREFEKNRIIMEKLITNLDEYYQVESELRSELYVTFDTLPLISNKI